MAARKRKKSSRYRGSTTHGKGSMKKRRGAGNRGGRGRAGTGKRADSKKPSIWADKYYFGKRGFKKKNKAIVNPINIKTLQERVDEWVMKKIAEFKNGIYTVDLAKAGYNKLIGSGMLIKRINLKVERATEGAIEAVKKSGGNVELMFKEEEKKEAPQKKADEAAGEAA